MQEIKISTKDIWPQICLSIPKITMGVRNPDQPGQTISKQKIKSAGSIAQH